MQLDFDSAWRHRHLVLTRALACALTLVLGACATVPSGPDVPATPVRPTAPPLPRTAEPPPPKVNLSGFPLAYRQGYADGCASASGPERKDAGRFASDGNYGMGWQDGIALCRKR
ncbi:MAG: hypothetical protein ABI920_01675 [Casimicrobiaceae bacterium]